MCVSVGEGLGDRNRKTVELYQHSSLIINRMTSFRLTAFGVSIESSTILREQPRESFREPVSF